MLTVAWRLYSLDILQSKEKPHTLSLEPGPVVELHPKTW